MNPEIMGILNLSPDSPVVSSIFKGDIERDLVDRAERMVEEGASYIDIGGNSSSSLAIEISPLEEEKRILEAVKILCDSGFQVSVDSWTPSILKKALDLGISVVNDISGGSNPEILNLIETYKPKYCVMHQITKPKMHYSVNQNFPHLIERIVKDLNNVGEYLISKGIPKKKIYLDPGFGFGRDGHSNMEILRHLEELKFLGYPILVSASKKAFLGEYLPNFNRSQKDPRLYEATLAFNLLLMLKGTSVLRVHDVKGIAIVRDVVKEFFNVKL